MPTLKRIRVPRPSGPKPGNGNHYSSLPCPRCHASPTKAVSSFVKVTSQWVKIKRQRRCMKCYRLFTTYEGYARNRIGLETEGK